MACYKLLSLILYSLLVGLSTTAPVFGHSPIEQEWAHQLAKSVQFIEVNENDSALFYLPSILDQLAQESLFDSPFGLKVQMTLGKALEQDHQDARAITLLNEVHAKTKQKEQWKTYAGSCLALAQLHLKIWRENLSQQHLDLAKRVIMLRQVNELVPEYLMLKAYWHSNFGYPDSVYLYARQALDELSPEVESRVSFQLDYYTLMGKMNENVDIESSIDHYLIAVHIARRVKDYGQLAYLLHQISLQYGYEGSIYECLQYNDSTIHACYQAIADGQSRMPILAEAYLTRSNVYKNLGQLDSALIYNSKGSAQKLQFVREQEKLRVIEIDAKYNNEKKTIQLAEQQKQIRAGRQIRWLLLAVILLVLMILAIIIRNFFKERQINQTLAEQAKQLTALDKMKSQFFANVSHELRTPLSLLNGPIQSLLQNSERPEKERKLLELARKSGKQLDLLIKEILDLEKLSVGKLQLDFQQTELKAFLIPYVAQFESRASFKGIDYVYQVSIEERLSAAIDQEKCRQILFNLLSNAMKFTDRDGKVEVHISTDADDLMMQVEDTGKGIPPEDLPHIFDRFFQSSKTNGPLLGGTGIGLAICKEYVQLMGGEIEVKSQLHAGTLLSVRIPLRSPQWTNLEVQPFSLEHELPEEALLPLIANGNSSPSTVLNGAKPHLLVVEDNPDLQTYLSLTLSDQYQITMAQHGQEALDQLASSHQFQLILSDLMMPVMDGHQLLEQLKAQDQTRHIPVIMLTALADPKSKLKSLRLGVDDYLLKPFHEAELTTRIDNLLRRQALRQEVAVKENGQAQSPMISAADQEWLTHFEAFIQAHLDSDILSVEMMAEAFHMSKSTLLRQLKRLTGFSPKQYLLEARLNQARQLLENRSYRSVKQVAHAIGYRDVRPFSRLFKKRFGKLPSEV